MQRPLYAIDDNVTPENYYLPCPKRNKLNLLPEHLAQIDMAFLRQLTLAKLEGRQIRIVMAVFCQTIGYDKFEDDMNGTRIEQLTGVRGDHAGAIVRDLERFNVLITRRGHYGKWMSINFNFEQWGEISSEPKTNDPSCLLSDHYQPMTADEIIGFEMHKPPQSVNKNHTVATPVASSIAPTTPEIPTNPTTPIAPKTPEIPTNPTTPIVPDIVPKTPEIPTNSATPVVPKTSEIPTNPTTPIAPKTPEIPTNSTTPVVPKTPVIPTSPVSPSPVIPAVSNQEASINTTKEGVETPIINRAIELDYPESIPEKLRRILAKHLQGFKIPEQAQRLLNYFARCLRERDIRNPIAYFVALKNRLFNGQLDLDESEYQHDVDATKKAQAEQTQARIAYQNAVLELQQLKKVVESVRDSKKCTFEEALQAVNYVNIWQKANECLIAAQEALKRTQLQSG